jgi:hypothetical protein
LLTATIAGLVQQSSALRRPTNSFWFAEQLPERSRTGQVGLTAYGGHVRLRIAESWRPATAIAHAKEVATFKKLEGSPNWTMEWITDDQFAKAAFERVVRSVQTQIELE